MIELRPMTEKEFSEYIGPAISLYAEEKMKGEGYSPDEAKKIASDSFYELLSNGVHTENQFLFSIFEKSSSKNIGMIWFAKNTDGRPHAFVYDFILDADSRGQGFGKAALQLLEDEVKKQGLSAIGLHVFGHNAVAIHLYEKVGFRTTNRVMMKDL